MNLQQTNRLMVSASPWILMAISAVLMGLIIFQTVMMYNRDKQHMISLLTEKGAALIKSVEADIRIQMPDRPADLQPILETAAFHPDVSYVALIALSRKILAHSDRKMTGTLLDTAALQNVLTDPDSPGWRIIEPDSRTRFFEVYRPARFPLPGTMETPDSNDSAPALPDPLQWTSQDRPVILMGMDAQPFEQAVIDDLHHNIVMIILVFLTGLTGMVSFFWSRSVIRSRRLLQDTRAFAAETIASLPMGIIIVDRHRHIRYMNDTACALSGIRFPADTKKTAEQMLPENIWDLHQAADAPGKGKEMEIVVDLEKSGSIPVSVMVTQIFGQTGAFIGYLFIVKDLRQIRALEQEIRRKERLAALGTLASGIAHEVRNPLSSIKGYAGFFGSLFDQGSKNKKAARLMVEEIDRVDRVISELLEFARPADLQLRTTQPEPLVRHSLHIIRHEAQTAGIQINESITTPLSELSLDPDRFTQVLLNLYINAIQAMPDGGVLTVDVRMEKTAVCFAVSDTGHGIVPDDQTAVFNPYFTTKKQGTGLGLAIVHKIIESHNGTIRLESHPGKGTVFFISIPLKKPQRKPS
ncbi:MAG TPA: ATP-binding protein [Desulfotignum sp.]|nr:ATP-binding protein [Desulfotignum sp.]